MDVYCSILYSSHPLSPSEGWGGVTLDMMSFLMSLIWFPAILREPCSQVLSPLLSSSSQLLAALSKGSFTSNRCLFLSVSFFSTAISLVSSLLPVCALPLHRAHPVPATNLLYLQWAYQMKPELLLCLSAASFKFHCPPIEIIRAILPPPDWGHFTVYPCPIKTPEQCCHHLPSIYNLFKHFFSFTTYAGRISQRNKQHQSYLRTCELKYENHVPFKCLLFHL